MPHRVADAVPLLDADTVTVTLAVDVALPDAERLVTSLKVLRPLATVDEELGVGD